MTKAPVPSEYSPTLPTFQVAWDSTSLGWLKTCPRLYQYQKIQGRQPRNRSIHLTFGGLYASGVEQYAKARALGQDHHTATLTMVRWVLEHSGTRTDDGEWTPWDSNDTLKNRYTLIRSLVWNVEDRLGSPYHTLILANGKPAVELSFSFHAFDIAGEPIFLSGHMDEVVELDGQYFVKDDKTSKSALNANYFQHYTPDNQMSLYSIAGRIVLNLPIRGVLVRASQIGVNFNRYATAQVIRPQAVLDEWMGDAQWWISQALTFARANYWPMNDKSCFNCPFAKVCAVSPSHRQAWLEQDFELRHWNPLETR